LCLLISVLGNTGSVKFTSHTLPIHTRLAKGNTGSFKFTFTHALVKGLRRCTSYLL
jgi:hypothetical protein